MIIILIDLNRWRNFLSLTFIDAFGKHTNYFNILIITPDSPKLRVQLLNGKVVATMKQKRMMTKTLEVKTAKEKMTTKMLLPNL
jgi:hypothetical protein